MKIIVNNLLDWFENKFNFVIELLALLGGVFSILFSVILFLILLIDSNSFTGLSIGIVLLPGIVGFAGVFILFALRITRFITTLDNKKD